VVQVGPIKPTLKSPGTKRLKLEFDKLLSSFDFSFNLRRYIMELRNQLKTHLRMLDETLRKMRETQTDIDDRMAGAYTRSQFSST